MRGPGPAPDLHGLQARQFRRELALVSGLAAVASVASFLWFYLHGQVLLYGDAVAHINIARRVVDSRTPGPLQLGTVWLPLPHLLTLPFVVNNWMWRSGVGGSIASMLAYVCAVAGVFRLVRAAASRLAAWLAAGLLGLNPNLLYMQATAMTEPLFLATLIWAVVYFHEFTRAIAHICQKKADAGHHNTTYAQFAPWKALERCAVVLAAAMLVRYDGWVFAFVVGCASLILTLRGARARSVDAISRRRLLRSLAASVLLCALVPALWLAHNYALDGKPLDWWNGPYSAKAIEQRTSGGLRHPGTDNPTLAALYFAKAARMNFAQGRWQGWMLALAAGGTLLAWFYHRRSLLLLWFPLPFYACAIAYGSVPIFLPVWYPFSHYNVRYGLELLPAFAVFAALAVTFACQLFAHTSPGWRRPWAPAALAAVLVLVLSANYLRVAAATPICLREAQANSAARLRLQSRLAEALRHLPPRSTLLMSTREYVGTLQAADLPLRRVVSEATESTELDWDAGLSCPAQVADYVVTIGGDAVAQAVERNPRWLEKIVAFNASGQPEAALYRSRFPRRRQ
jgi:hypothetical protein